MYISMKYPISCALIKVFNTKSSEILENCKLAFVSDRLHYLLLLGKYISIINTHLLILHFVRLLLPSRCQAIRG